jgi:hypothetical protein
METYPHLVSSQIPHIFIIYLYSKKSFCNILNSQNIADNIFANEQYHKKIMFSGDIELTPGSVFCNSVQNNSPTI